MSTDGGSNWSQANEGFPSPISIQSLAAHGDFLYAGTPGYGAYKRLLSQLIAIQVISSRVPEEFFLFQNYPNPFNAASKIRYQISKAAIVKLVVLDVLGREIDVLVNEKLQPGTYEVTWDAGMFPSGLHFYQLRAANYQPQIEFQQTRKMLLIR